MATDELVELVKVSTAELVKQAETLEPLLGEAKQAGRIGAQMEAGGFGPEGPFKFAPREAVSQAYEGFKAEDDGRLGRMLADIEDGIRLLERFMPEAEINYMAAPTVEAVIRQRVPNIESTPGTYLTGQLLAVTLESVLSPTIDRASVGEAHRLYVAALSDPLVPRHAMVIALIERKVAEGTFAGATGPEAIDLLADLARRVQQQRQARIPKEIRVWRDGVARGRRALILARAANLKPAQSIEQQHLVTLMKTLS